MQTIYAVVDLTNHQPSDPNPTPPIIGMYATERAADLAALYAEAWQEQPADARPVHYVTEFSTLTTEPDLDFVGSAEADAAFRRN